MKTHWRIGTCGRTRSTRWAASSLNALEREREAGVPDRRADALPALTHRGIRQAHRRKRGQPLAHVDLDADQRRVDAGQQAEKTRASTTRLAGTATSTPGPSRPPDPSGPCAKGLQAAIREVPRSRTPSDGGSLRRAAGPAASTSYRAYPSGCPAVEAEGVLEMPHAGHPARLVERHPHHVEAAGPLAEPPRSNRDVVVL